MLRERPRRRRRRPALGRRPGGLALFRGEVLPDAGDWAAPHRVAAGRAAARLLEDALAARVDLGAGGEVVAELEALVEAHPLREGLWATLITALYRAGRQADALAAYAAGPAAAGRRARLEPGPALRALEQQVLRQSPSLRAGAGRAPVARRATCRRRPHPASAGTTTSPTSRGRWPSTGW